MKGAVRSLQAVLLAASLATFGSRASAQVMEESLSLESNVASPEWVAWELRVGPYVPDVGSTAFEDTFGNDKGLLWATEIDVLLYRIPYVGPIGVGGAVGWASYTGDAFQSDTGERVSEETSLTLFPLSLMAVLRVDVLARELGFPFIVTGKLGADYVRWSAETGNRDDGSGGSLGLRWAAQLALELDFFNPRSARVLDEEWGINHTFLFGEVYGSTADSTLPVGDTTFAFGLGMIL